MDAEGVKSRIWDWLDWNYPGHWTRDYDTIKCKCPSSPAVLDLKESYVLTIYGDKVPYYLGERDFAILYKIKGALTHHYH